MIGNFRLVKKFASVMSKFVYEDVYFDRFNSVRRGFYLVVGQQQLADMIRNNQRITFIKIPSTRNYDSQDVTQIEFYDRYSLSEEQRRMITLLNSVISTQSYSVIEE